MILAEQIGIGNDDRDSDQNQRVEKRAADDGIDHQAAGFFGREVEFFSGLGDRVETHEQPRGNGEDGQYAGYRGTPFGKEGNRLSTWEVSVATLPRISTSTPPARAKARMSWRLLAMSMPLKFI